MRFILTAFLLSVTFFNHAQLVDDFSDGDFSLNPAWTGDLINFEVDVNNRLRLNAPAVTDTMFLVTSNAQVDNMEWTFLVDLDFNPSSANLARVYLMSDQNNLKQSLNGYFVQIGNTTDEVSLYRQDGLSITEIIDGTDDVVDMNPVSARVKVTRTAAGLWDLETDNTGNFNYTTQGSVTDNTHSNSTHFGVFCKYTSTRSDLFYFDDFEIESMTILDTIPPQIINIDVISNQVLHLSFTENIDQVTASNTNNYMANNGLGIPSQAQLLPANSQIVELSYAIPFQDGLNYTLSVQGVEDDSGNVMPNSNINFLYNEPFFGKYKDVVITEIMADPSPVVGLPEAEYIELYNNTNQTFSLENWTISDGSTTVTLNDQLFSPQSYLLCYDPTGGINYGIFNTVEGPIPSLNNAGDVIVLRDSNGIVIDSVAYSSTWYNNSDKADGGWSLELKNFNSPCHDATNWSASENTIGGTPGFENSIFTDVLNADAPTVLSAFAENDSVIHFNFDQNVNSGNVTIVPSLDFNFSLNGSNLSVSLANVNSQTTYDILVSGFVDCWGNTMADYTFVFALPDSIQTGDIILNEILFNPANNGADYIEIVNISDKILSLDGLQIANIDDGIIDNIKPVSINKILFFPGEYKVLTEDSMAVIETFPNAKRGPFIEIDLPAYSNDSGTVILLQNDFNVVDKFSYSEDLHFALIDDLNGKALERLSFNQLTQSESNWVTASESEGWGTPGYLNSQTSNPTFEQEVQLSQAIFSPDNDGYQDVLEMTYQFDNPDNVMDVVVYNAFGQPVRELKDNFFPGQKGTVIWDGITNDGTKANVGTYILGITVFDLDGNVKRYKLVGVLAARL